MDMKKLFEEIEEVLPDKHYDLLQALEIFKNTLNETIYEIQEEFDKKMNERNFKDVENLLDIVEEFNELARKVNEIKIKKNNPDINKEKIEFREKENKEKCVQDIETNDYLEKNENLIYQKEKSFPLFLLGREPDGIREELNHLRCQLDEKYSNKILPTSIRNDKKIWSIINKLYFKLGYSTGKIFLEAYGYKLLEE